MAHLLCSRAAAHTMVSEGNDFNKTKGVNPVKSQRASYCSSADQVKLFTNKKYLKQFSPIAGSPRGQTALKKKKTQQPKTSLKALQASAGILNKKVMNHEKRRPKENLLSLKVNNAMPYIC